MQNTHHITENELTITLQTQTPENARELLQQGLRAALYYYINSKEKLPQHEDGLLQLLELQQALE